MYNAHSSNFSLNSEVKGEVFGRGYEVVNGREYLSSVVAVERHHVWHLIGPDAVENEQVSLLCWNDEHTKDGPMLTRIKRILISVLTEYMMSMIAVFCLHWSGVVGPTTTQPVLPPLKAPPLPERKVLKCYI